MFTSDGFHTEIRVIPKVNALIQCIILYKINENEFYLKKIIFIYFLQNDTSYQQMFFGITSELSMKFV